MELDPSVPMFTHEQLLQPPVRLVPAPRYMEDAEREALAAEVSKKLVRRRGTASPMVHAPERQAKMLVIIPAHDEEDGILDTLQEVVNQSRRPDKVVVVADNCTDRTEDLVRKFMRKHPIVELMTTYRNKDRKVGALN